MVRINLVFNRLRLKISINHPVLEIMHGKSFSLHFPDGLLLSLSLELLYIVVCIINRCYTVQECLRFAHHISPRTN